ncbi:MAG: DUF456 domain-containing protein [Halorientalis sp.]
MTPLLAAGLGAGPVVWLALALALAGVLGTLVPLVPGALLSLSGVYLYWWATGYTDPGLLVLGALTLLGLLIVVIDWFAGAVSAKVSGASNLTTLLAGVVGFVLFFLVPVVGLLIGVAGVVFLSELQRTGDAAASARTAVYTTVGMLASTVAQFLLTTLLVLGFLLAVLL